MKRRECSRLDQKEGSHKIYLSSSAFKLWSTKKRNSSFKMGTNDDFAQALLSGSLCTTDTSQSQQMQTASSSRDCSDEQTQSKRPRLLPNSTGVRKVVQQKSANDSAHMESDSSSGAWVNHRCKSGEILYQYNLLTGERRWQNSVRNSSDRPELEHTTEDTSTSKNADCMQALLNSTGLDDVQDWDSASDTDTGSSTSTCSETTLSADETSQYLDVKIEPQSDEEQYCLADMLPSKKQNSHPTVINPKSRSCVAVRTENGIRVKPESENMSSVPITQTYVIADLLKSANQRTADFVPTMTTESHLTRYCTENGRNQRNMGSKTTSVQQTLQQRGYSLRPGSTLSLHALNSNPRIAEKARTSLKCLHCLQCFPDVRSLGEHPCFKCSTCGRHLRDSKEFVDHRKAHLLEQPFKCQNCSPWFKVESNLQRFLEVHSARHQFECVECNSVYGRSTPYRYLIEPIVHIRARLLEKPFLCRSCNPWFKVESNLERFLEVHSGQEEFVCQQCKSTYERTNSAKGSLLKCTFPTKCNLLDTSFKCIKCCPWFRVESNLKKFLKVHSQESDFVCAQCKSTYVRPKTTRRDFCDKVFETVFHSRKCGMCGKTLETSSYYNQHCHAHMLERHFKCFNCSFSFTQETYVEKYLGVHSNRNHFVCSHCGRAFVRSDKRNSFLEPAYKRYHCEECNMSFPLSKSYKCHMDFHSGKVFTCEKCNNVFRTSKGMNDHIRLRHRDPNSLRKEYKCNECGKSFKSSFSLSGHVIVHRKPDEVFECKECGRLFTSRRKIKWHARLHLKFGGGKVFRCKNCNKEFHVLEGLSKHTRFHCDLNSGHVFECKQCKRSFDTSKKLNCHLRAHRNNFECRQCGKGFARSATLTKHVEEHTSDGKLECPQCKKLFSSSKKLEKHVIVHKFYCKQCKKEFSSSEALRKHLEQHPEDKRFECKDCHKKYVHRGSYEKHLKVHLKS